MAQVVKNLPATHETWVQSLGWEDPLEKGMAYPPRYSCLENPHGQRSLVGYSPWGHKESDPTQCSTFLFVYFLFFCIEFMSCLYVLEIKSLSVICKYFVPFCRLPFHFVYGFLAVQNLLGLIKSHLFTFALGD